MVEEFNSDNLNIPFNDMGIFNITIRVNMFLI